VLSNQYGLTHTTLQVDHVGEDLLQVGRYADHCADAHGPVHRGEDHRH
jgi:cobalt-zinc-cadmium efflux system protein